MPDISSIGHGQVGPVDRTAPAPPPRRDPPEATRPEAPLTRPGDRVEVSDHARLLDRLRHLPEARVDRVDRVRTAIAEGTYETSDKLATAIDRLLQDIG